MALAQCPYIVQDPTTGAAVSGASVEVYLRDTTTPASIFQDEAGGTPQSNPVLTVNGKIPAFAAQGSYDLVVTGTNFTATREWEAIRGDSVTNLANNSVGTAQIQNGAIGTTQIADGAISSTKFASGEQPDQAFTSQKFFYREQFGYGGGTGTTPNGVFVIGSSQNATWNTVPVVVGSDQVAGTGMFYFDPSWFAVSGRTLQLFVNQIFANGYSASGVGNTAVPNGATFTTGLYPVTGLGGTGQLTLGSVVTGSTSATAPTTANSIYRSSSGAFAAPTAGFYVVAVNITGFNSTSGNYAIVGSIYYTTS